MSGRLLTFILVAVVLALLVGLNLLFISEPRAAENELMGDRSSYKSTPYGTLAYYTVLEETGRAVERFEQPYTSLEEAGFDTLLVIVPDAEHQPTEEEIEALDAWVVGGGHLIVADRQIVLGPPLGEVATGGPIVGPVRATIPSPYTRGVEGLALSEYATTVSLASGGVVHFEGANGALLVDRPHGSGHTTFLSEPYVLQNNGIREQSNLALALNLVDGVGTAERIAFDEFHHGHGRGGDTGGLRGYIAGTPVPWAIAQIGLVALVVAVSIGARFARAVPLRGERRTSALEFVSSMANIQRLARASDLAIENVYGSFRNRLCRYANVPSDTPTKQLASAAAARSDVDARRLHVVMRRCEEALKGAPPSPQDLVRLVADLREVEKQLKL
jgi:hypothetical protein